MAIKPKLSTTHGRQHGCRTGFESWNIEYLLPSIEVPLLVIQGSDDQYASADHAAGIASKTSGYARVEIVDNCAHVPHIEAQAVVLQLMADFIAQIHQ